METTIDQSQETLVHPNNPRKIVAPKPLWFLEWGIVSIHNHTTSWRGKMALWYFWKRSYSPLMIYKGVRMLTVASWNRTDNFLFVSIATWEVLSSWRWLPAISSMREGLALKTWSRSHVISTVLCMRSWDTTKQVHCSFMIDVVGLWMSCLLCFRQRMQNLTIGVFYNSLKWNV